MKTEDLMNAIENIDDRFVEESAWGVRPKTRIPWGLIATAACFCLVIGAVIFMGQAGLMPMLPGQGTTATQPAPSTDTQPSYEDTVTPTGYATLDDAIIDVYYNKYLKEQAEKMVTEGWAKDESEIRASVSVRHIASYGDVYAVFMGDNVFAYSQAFRKEDVGGLIFEFTSGQPLMIYRNYDITQLADAYAQDWLTDAQLAQLQTHFTPTPNTEPAGPQTTVPEDTIGSPAEGSQLSWFGRVLSHEYDSPKNILLAKMFAGGFPEESTQLTAQEEALLKGNDISAGVKRLPVKKINAFLQECFGIIISEMNPAPTGLPGFIYLKETDCYYLIGSAYEPARDVVIGKSETLKDGTILVEYTKDGAEDTYVFALREIPAGFRILYNRKGSIAQETGKAAELEKINALFADLGSRYNRAAGQFYQSPENLKLLYYFYDGFEGESQRPTDAEWKELEGRPGFNINYDLFRLPVDKMNADLQKHFGITVGNLSQESFDGLVYLQSTNCYYFMATGANGYAEGFQATDVQTQSDGTLLVTYTVQSNSAIYKKTTCQMGLKAVGDGYQILYNRAL